MAVRPRGIGLLLTAVLLGAPLLVHADPPPRPLSATEELRRTFDEVIAMGQSASFRALEPARRREIVRKVSDRLFNWPEIAKRALGPHWNERTAAERRTFAEWLASLAEHAYAGSIAQLTTRHVPSDAVRYLGETRSGPDTIVRAVLTYPRDLPIDFLMNRRAGRWEVCDVRVDGVSAAENYRAQVERIMAGGSFPALVDRMNAKTASAAGP